MQTQELFVSEFCKNFNSCSCLRCSLTYAAHGDATDMSETHAADVQTATDKSDVLLHANPFRGKQSASLCLNSGDNERKKVRVREVSV